MNISIFTLIGNIGNTPDYWQYAWQEALNNYLSFADEVVIVNGCDQDIAVLDRFTQDRHEKVKVINLPWPYDFHWSEIAKHFNAGLKACTGDWIMKMDIDYIIHEQDFKLLRRILEGYFKSDDVRVASFMKYTVLDRNRAYLKVPVPFIINRHKIGKTIRFGIARDVPHNAWGYPIQVEGFDEKIGLPYGRQMIPERIKPTGIKVWNYDNFFRTKEITEEHWWRFSQARIKAGFSVDWGDSKEVSLKNFANLKNQRNKKTQQIARKLQLADHPAVMQERVKNMTPEMYGYSNWNNFEGLI